MYLKSYFKSIAGTVPASKFEMHIDILFCCYSQKPLKKLQHFQDALNLRKLLVTSSTMYEHNSLTDKKKKATIQTSSSLVKQQ